MWLNLVGMAFKTGATIYKNRQDSRRLRSEAERLHYEKMAKPPAIATQELLDDKLFFRNPEEEA